MHQKVFRFLFMAFTICIGLISAFFLFFGVEWVFERDVHATAVNPAISSTTDPFIINFSMPVDRTSYEGEISIEPVTPVLVGWNGDSTALSIKPQERWETDTQYRVSLGEGNTWFGRSVGATAFSFQIPGYPKIVSITPENGATDVMLGIEDPIIVRFDRSTKYFYVDFQLSPSPPVVYENNAEKTEFKLLPKEALQPGTKYQLFLQVKRQSESDDQYVDLGGTTFTTLPEKPKTIQNTLALRLEDAKRFAYAIIATGKYIDIDIMNQVMTIFENGKLLDAYLVSSGKRGMDTPKGSYEIRNKAPRPWSKKYELYMPYWMAITSDGKYGIHELPEWPNGYKEEANHLGIPVSHGCVRLGVGPAGRVYDWADVGTPVIVR